MASLVSFRLLWLAPGLGFIGVGFPGVLDSIVLAFPREVSPVLGLPWYRFRTYWFSLEGAWMRNLSNLRCFIGVGSPCAYVSYVLAFPVSLFSLIVARPGFGFHRFRLSRCLGFGNSGVPL